MNWRRLIALFSTTSTKRPDIKQDSLFLKLPLCLIYDIFDKLDWPDKVVFSQTCGGLWYHLHSKCISTFRKATSEDRLKYLTMLSNVLLDHYVCERCRVLHRINPEDLPSNFRVALWIYHAPCPRVELKEGRAFFSTHYAFGYRHVQLAFKYSRLGGEAVHQRHLNGIMGYSAALINRSSQPRKKSVAFTACPRFVQGNLIVRARYHFFEDLPKISCWKILETDINFCPHHSISKMGYRRDPIKLIVGSLFQRPSGTPYSGFQQRIFSCDECPSDYEFIMIDGMLTVSVWRNLGTGTGLEDRCWQAQIFNYYEYPRESKFSYEHGSIRTMFDSASAS